MKNAKFTAILMTCTVLVTGVSAKAATVLTYGKSALPPTHFNGFEGTNGALLSPPVYTEDGIEVSYVGTLSFTNIWTSSGVGEGSYSWYPNGGGFGYTKVTFDPVSAIQFMVGSGWYSTTAAFAYEVLYQGTVVASGQVPGIAGYPGQAKYYGFSGGVFDELHLQVLSSPGPFGATSYEAGIFDSFGTGVAGGPGVPEPQSWAMMIGGFALAGGALRRRRYNLKVSLA